MATTLTSGIPSPGETSMGSLELGGLAVGCFLGKNYQVNKPGVSQLVSLLPGRGILVLNQIEFEIPVPGLQGFGTWASPLNSSLF